MNTLPQPSRPDSPPLPDIVQRYLNGESLQALAQECGKSRHTLYRWMMSGVGDQDYEALITDALINRIADADQSLEESADPCDIARARERMKFSRMDFERRRPKLYGPKQELAVDHAVTVVIKRLGPVQVSSEPAQASPAAELEEQGRGAVQAGGGQ